MADLTILESEIAKALFDADFYCRFEHGCRNGADCEKCELLAQGCTKTYIARYLMERFDIRFKEDA